MNYVALKKEVPDFEVLKPKTIKHYQAHTLALFPNSSKREAYRIAQVLNKEHKAKYKDYTEQMNKEKFLKENGYYG